MSVRTATGEPVSEKLLHNYFKTLVDHFFKILPMREEEEKSLSTYIRSLQIELIGCKEFIPQLQDDADFLRLLGLTQYLMDNPSCSVREVRREVFHAISICNKLKAVYMRGGVQR